jgi:N-acetylglucosamine-6-phosphate deacetylase
VLGVISMVGRLLAPEDQGVRLVVIDEGRVARIADAGEAPPEAIGGSDAWIVPGLVDLQLNGGFGVDFSDPAAEAPRAATALPSTGVTAFVPTIVSAAPDRYAPAIANLSGPMPPGAARALGVHLEGPYLSPGYRGTHDASALRPPDIGEARGWLAEGPIRIVTLAPELPGAIELIEWLTAEGVVVAIGHTEATWQQADEAIRAGARLGTHLFNAMRPLHHRDPGVVGRLMAPGVTVSVVCDGIHVAPEVVALIANLKAPDELIFVTDGLAALGQPPGRYRLGSQEVANDGTVARLADGTISGSVSPMAPALGRLVASGIEAETVVRAASTNPARLLGVDDDLGRIEVGRVADLCLLDAAWNPVSAIVRGVVAAF